MAKTLTTGKYQGGVGEIQLSGSGSIPKRQPILGLGIVTRLELRGLTDHFEQSRIYERAARERPSAALVDRRRH